MRGEDEPRVVLLKSSAPRAIEWAAERLAAGGVIAMPTDTVYGIAASLGHPGALRRLYEIKGRDQRNPLPVLVSSPSAVEHLAEAIPPDVALLLDRFWPGPLTIVVPAKPGMPVEVTAGGTTVGLRMPNHPLAIEVIERAGGSVACTSANHSGEPPALNAREVADILGTELDLILDGGGAPGGVPSTVIEVTDDGIRVIREGAIPSDHIRAAWQELKAGHARG